MSQRGGDGDGLSQRGGDTWGDGLLQRGGDTWGDGEKIGVAFAEHTPVLRASQPRWEHT